MVMPAAHHQWRRLSSSSSYLCAKIARFRSLVLQIEARAKMGAFLSSPSSKSQPWEEEAPRPDSSKKPRISSAPPSDHPRLIPGLPDEISLQILARMPRMGYLKAKLVSRSWTAAVAGAELYRLRKELGVTEEWLYILTRAPDQRLAWHALDPATGQWQRLPLMPGLTDVAGGECRRGGGGSGFQLGDLITVGVRITDAIRGWFGQKDHLVDRIPFYGCAVGAAGGCIYVLGGFSRAAATRCAWRYDPFLNSWQEVSSMGTGRAFCKTTLLNNKLYVAGGVSKGKDGLAPLQSAEVLDPATGVWEEVPDMAFLKAQALPTAFLADLLKPIATGMTSYRGKLYVPQSLYSWPFFVDVGGEVFDPEANSWAEMPPGMGEGWPARRAGTKLSAVVDGELYALEPSTATERGKIKMYDPQEDTWKVAVSQVPVGDFAESESPYLLAGFIGKLHLIIKDVDSTINVMRTDFLKPGDSSAGATCQNPDVSSEEETDVWKTVASKNFAAAELVSCQVLSI